MRTFTVQVDDTDYEWITRAIAFAQKHYRIGGELYIADGDGPLGGRLLAELCRGWMERAKRDTRGHRK